MLELSDEPEPVPGDDELLVAVEAVGVNYRDVYEREGRGAAYGRGDVLGWIADGSLAVRIVGATRWKMRAAPTRTSRPAARPGS